MQMMRQIEPSPRLAAGRVQYLENSLKQVYLLLSESRQLRHDV